MMIDKSAKASKERINVEREELAEKKFPLNYNSSRKESASEIFMDISYIEVQRIFESRKKCEKENRDRELMSTMHFSLHSDKIVENVSKKIIDTLVHKVCDEILDSNLIAKLINLELKE